MKYSSDRKFNRFLWNDPLSSPSCPLLAFRILKPNHPLGYDLTFFSDDSELSDLVFPPWLPEVPSLLWMYWVFLGHLLCVKYPQGTHITQVVCFPPFCHLKSHKEDGMWNPGFLANDSCFARTEKSSGATHFPCISDSICTKKLPVWSQLCDNSFLWLWANPFREFLCRIVWCTMQPVCWPDIQTTVTQTIYSGSGMSPSRWALFLMCTKAPYGLVAVPSLPLSELQFHRLRETELDGFQSIS